MSTFSDIIRSSQAGRPDIPDSWKQGRTAYGGLTAALLLDQAQRDNPDLPALRSALINFTGPVTKGPDLQSEILRQGRNVTTVYATAVIDGGTVGTATFSFGTSRESHISVDCPAPDAKEPDVYEPFIPPNGEAFAPNFIKNFDLRLIDGARPLQGERGYVRCWARHQEENSRSGTGALLCLADVLPPAAFPLFRRLGPISSMTWICNVMTDEVNSEDGWYQIEADLSAASDGYSSQVMRIWKADGTLLVEGMQSVAMFV